MMLACVRKDDVGVRPQGGGVKLCRVTSTLCRRARCDARRVRPRQCEGVRTAGRVAAVLE